MGSEIKRVKLFSLLFDMWCTYQSNTAFKVILDR